LPRVDRGSYVVDVGSVLRLSPGERRVLVEWALSEGALLVTEPTVVSVDSVRGALLVALGVGSLVSEARPPVGEVWVLARPEWIDGCRVGVREPRVERGGSREGPSGTVTLLDVRDPVARLVNGSQGVVAGDAPPPGPLAVAALHGLTAVELLPGGGYRLWLLRGEALERAEYIAPLASSCG